MTGPDRPTRTAAGLLVECLEVEGCDWVFSVPGEETMDILDAVWGTEFVAESNVVNRHIRSLRFKLQDDYRSLCFISTVPGQGYRFIPTFSNDGWAWQQDQAEQTHD